MKTQLQILLVAIMTLATSFNQALSQPDLRVESITRQPPPSLNAGQTSIRIEGEMINSGNANAGPFYIGYWLSKGNTSIGSGDVLLGEQYKSSLPADGYNRDFEYNVSIPNNTVTGNDYFIVLRMDNRSQISESNESNNTKATRQLSISGVNPQPTTKTTVLSFNTSSPCTYSTTCNYFANISQPCTNFTIKASHGSPRYASAAGIKYIELIATSNSNFQDQGEGFFVTYPFKAGSEYTITVAASGTASTSHLYGEFEVAFANGLTARNDNCNLGIKPNLSSTNRDVIISAGVGSNLNSFTTKKTLTKNYSYLWIYSSYYAYLATAGVAIDKITIVEKTPNGRLNTTAIKTKNNKEILQEQKVDVSTELEVLDFSSYAFPNPVKEEINFSIKDQSANVKLLDASGRIIWSGKAAQGLNKISVADKPKGIYYMEIQTASGKQVQKIIKE